MSGLADIEGVEGCCLEHEEALAAGTAAIAPSEVAVRAVWAVLATCARITGAIDRLPRPPPDAPHSGRRPPLRPRGMAE